MINRGLKRSFLDFARHPWLHLVSILTITVALLVMGVFFLAYRNFEKIAEKTAPQLTGTVYLKEELKDFEVQRLKEKILSLENVQKVQYKAKHSVIQELQTFLGSTNLENLPGSELFPDVFEIIVKPETSTQSIGALKNIISRIPEVAEADFSDDWLAQYKKVKQVITITGFVLMIALVLACSFMIANFMGMRYQARKNEIEVISLFGASRNFIFAPLLCEGIIEGIIGAALSVSLLFIAKIFFATLIQVHWGALLSGNQIVFISMAEVALMFFIGVVMALLGGIAIYFRFQENNV